MHMLIRVDLLALNLQFDQIKWDVAGIDIAAISHFKVSGSISDCFISSFGNWERFEEDDSSDGVSSTVWNFKTAQNRNEIK